MIYKFYESTIDEPPKRPSPVSAYFYKLLHGPDFSLIKYSMGHAFDFIKGMQKIFSVFFNDDTPSNLKKVLQKVQVLIERHQFHNMINKEKCADFSNHEMLSFAYFIRYHYKQYFF